MLKDYIRARISGTKPTVQENGENEANLILGMTTPQKIELRC